MKKHKSALKAAAAVAVIVCLTVLSFSGCARIREAWGRGGGADDAMDFIVYAVGVTTSVEGRIRDHFSISGDVVAASTVDTFSDAAGRVSRLFVNVGSRVNFYDPIAEVDPSRPGMEFIPSLVRAPVGGTVIALPAELGMTVNQAFPMARIAAGDELEIRLRVAERFISRVALNQPSEIILNAWPGETFYGRIAELSPILDPASRTMETRVTVQNSDGRLRPGMFAQVRIITEERPNVVQIPSAAMLTRFGEQFIFVVDNSDPEAPVARRRDVVPGIMIDGLMEVVHGLNADEEVVIRGQTIIYDGARINVVYRTPPADVS
ncbi:MAG: efflux RND transporter periplasmic adaptor subunit [Treponema sp.]|nr:efflux RND transporter periplasmic adaptor subunit [Treponema sp.]